MKLRLDIGIIESSPELLPFIQSISLFQISSFQISLCLFSLSSAWATVSHG